MTNVVRKAGLEAVRTEVVQAMYSPSIERVQQIIYLFSHSEDPIRHAYLAEYSNNNRLSVFFFLCSQLRAATGSWTEGVFSAPYIVIHGEFLLWGTSERKRRSLSRNAVASAA